MSTLSIRERDAGIVAAVAAGETHAEVAARFGLKSSKSIQRALRRHEQRGGMAGERELAEPPTEIVIDPLGAVGRSLAEHDLVAEEARRLISETRNDAVRASGLKILASVAMQRVELLARFGAIPPGPQWATEVRLEAGWAALNDVAAAAGLNADELRDAYRARAAERIRYDGTSVTLAPLAPLDRQHPEAA